MDYIDTIMDWVADWTDNHPWLTLALELVVVLLLFLS